KQTFPSVPKRSLSPTSSFLAGFTKARQREPSNRLCSVASIAGSLFPRPIRRPVRRAAITLLSLITRQSPGCSRSGRSLMPRSTSSCTSPGFTTKSRAASRGTAGRSATRSAGSSKSKRSVRIKCLVHSGRPKGPGPALGRFRVSRYAAPRNDRGSFCGRFLREFLRPHCRLDDLVGVLNWFAALDLVDVLHAFDHLAPDRVPVVKEARIVEANEELAVAGIGAAGACHRYSTAHVGLVVEFGLELLPRSTGASALRAPGLRHEAIDHAVKYNAVVKSVLHQLLDPCHVPWCKVRPHLDHHFSFRCLQRQRIFRLRHLTPFHYHGYKQLRAP